MAIMKMADHWRCSVRELLGRLTEVELLSWLTYYGEHRFPEDRADLRSAIISYVCAVGAGAKSVKVEQFTPNYTPVTTNWLELKAELKKRSTSGKKHHRQSESSTKR